MEIINKKKFYWYWRGGRVDVRQANEASSNGRVHFSGSSLSVNVTKMGACCCVDRLVKLVVVYSSGSSVKETCFSIFLQSDKSDKRLPESSFE